MTKSPLTIRSLAQTYLQNLLRAMGLVAVCFSVAHCAQSTPIPVGSTPISNIDDDDDGFGEGYMTDEEIQNFVRSEIFDQREWLEEWYAEKKKGEDCNILKSMLGLVEISASSSGGQQAAAAVSLEDCFDVTDLDRSIDVEVSFCHAGATSLVISGDGLHFKPIKRGPKRIAFNLGVFSLLPIPLVPTAVVFDGMDVGLSDWCEKNDERQTTVAMRPKGSGLAFKPVTWYHPAFSSFRLPPLAAMKPETLILGNVTYLKKESKDNSDIAVAVDEDEGGEAKHVSVGVADNGYGRNWIIAINNAYPEQRVSKLKFTLSFDEVQLQ